MNSDDDTSFTSMLLQIIEFIHSIVESGKFKPAIKNVLADLIYIMIVYMQITEEQIVMWSEDSEQFVEDDYQEGMDGSIRVSSQDVLQTMAGEYGGKLLPALSEALARHVSVAEAEKASGSTHWWKIHEASMAAVGSNRDLVLARHLKFDLTQYLNYVRGSMSYDVSPYLLARCLWVLSRFASSEIYNTQTIAEILDAIISSLAADKPLNLRIYAVRSIHELCDSLKETTEERHAQVVAKLSFFLDGILGIVPQVQNTVLVLILEAITLIISVC